MTFPRCCDKHCRPARSPSCCSQTLPAPSLSELSHVSLTTTICIAVLASRPGPGTFMLQASASCRCSIASIPPKNTSSMLRIQTPTKLLSKLSRGKPGGSLCYMILARLHMRLGKTHATPGKQPYKHASQRCLPASEPQLTLRHTGRNAPSASSATLTIGHMRVPPTRVVCDQPGRGRRLADCRRCIPGTAHGNRRSFRRCCQRRAFLRGCLASPCPTKTNRTLNKLPMLAAASPFLTSTTGSAPTKTAQRLARRSTCSPPCGNAQTPAASTPILKKQLSFRHVGRAFTAVASQTQPLTGRLCCPKCLFLQHKQAPHPEPPTTAPAIILAAWQNIPDGRCSTRKGTTNLKQAAYHLLFAVRLAKLLRERSQTDPASLHCVLLGGPGCGKTRMLQLNNSLLLRYLPSASTLNTAATHAAARLVHGTTLHSALGLGHDTCAASACRRARTDLHALWSEVLFLRVDEISMISAEPFCRAEVAARALTQPNDLWGGVVLDVSGDLRQLPPVKATALSATLEPPTTATPGQLAQWRAEHADALQGLRLWRRIPQCICLQYSHRCSGPLATILQELTSDARLSGACCLIRLPLKLVAKWPKAASMTPLAQ